MGFQLEETPPLAADWVTAAKRLGIRRVDEFLEWCKLDPDLARKQGAIEMWWRYMESIIKEERT